MLGLKPAILRRLGAFASFRRCVQKKKVVKASTVDVNVGDRVAFPGFKARSYRGEAVITKVLKSHVWVQYTFPNLPCEDKEMEKKHMVVVSRTPPKAGGGDKQPPVPAETGKMTLPVTSDSQSPVAAETGRNTPHSATSKETQSKDSEMTQAADAALADSIFGAFAASVAEDEAVIADGMASGRGEPEVPDAAEVPTPTEGAWTRMGTEKGRWCGVFQKPSLGVWSYGIVSGRSRIHFSALVVLPVTPKQLRSSVWRALATKRVV